LADATDALGGAYVGGELDLFARAHNWKRYWSGVLGRDVRGRVLDVGAGLGASARLFASRPGIDSYLALEPDGTLAARMRGCDPAELPPGFEVREGTLASLDPQLRFDCILYIDVLEHIAADREELELAGRFLAPEGRIIVLAPAHAFLYSPFDAAVGHVRRYDRKSLRAAVPPGLAVERLLYLDSVGLLASLGNRMLLRAAQPSPAQISLWDGWMVPPSRLLDPLLLHRVGKTIVAVLRREAA
jgi:SAM-dependent methyltransferase